MSGRTLLIVVLVLGAGGFLFRGWARAVPVQMLSESQNDSTLLRNNAPRPSTVNEQEITVDDGANNKKLSLPATGHGEQSTIITVESGQTLSGVSRRYLGQFNNKITQKIQNLNPEIRDPNVIFAGAQVRLPAPSGTVDRSAAYSTTFLKSEEHTR